MTPAPAGADDAPGHPGHDVVAWCRAVCLGLPDATVDEPFSPGAEAFRVRRKIFALRTLGPAEPRTDPQP